MIRSTARVACTALLLTLGACSQPADPEGCTEDCFTPPPPICNGAVLTSFSALGACELDRCVYPAVTTDCAALGGTCAAGECQIPVDPCEGVTCDAPPEAACEGDTLVTWSEVGECNGETGACEYAAQRTECDAEGRVCDGDRCVQPADPCIDVVCDDEPADTCEGTVAVRYADSGTCEGGACVYAESARVDCAATGGECAGGRCSAVDPCDGVACDAPPAPRCVDGVAYSYPAIGTCTDGGECLYFETLTTCAVLGGTCGRTQCVVPGSCDGVFCDEPPAGRCVGNTLVVADAAGTCAAGDCTYPTTSVNCADDGNICADGACVAPDPCEGVICDTPPDPSCTGNARVAYSVPGTCSGGTCEYAERTTDCALTGQVCADGACLATDACAGVTCEVPPPPVCRGDVVVGYVAPGTCEDGDCWFETDETDCAEADGICEEGVCVPRDRCAAVVCTTPGPECLGDVAIEYFAPGTCEDGTCNRDGTFTAMDCAAEGLVCLLGECLTAGEALPAGAVRLSEILGGPAGVSTEAQWVELHNPRTTPVPLGGVSLRTLAAPVSELVFPADIVLAAGGYLTVGGSASGAALVWDAGFAIQSSDGIELGSAIGTIDAVDWRDDALPAHGGSSASRDPVALVGLGGALSDWCAGGAPDAPWGTHTQGTANIACSSRLPTGVLTISEFMVNGVALSGGADQWLEVHNATAAAIDLRGLFVRSGDGAGRILPDAVPVAAGERVLVKLGVARSGLRFAAAVPTALDASGDAIELRSSGAMVDGVAYATASAGGAWVFAAGRSKERSSSAADPSLPASWCDGAAPYAPAGNFGTPGATNGCP